MADLKAALAQLDPQNDAHWTNDGAPRIDVVAKLAGMPGLKRGDLTAAAPHFGRDHPILDNIVAAPQGQPEDERPDEGSGEAPSPTEDPSLGLQDEEGDEVDDLFQPDIDEVEVNLRKARREVEKATAAMEAAKRELAAANAAQDKAILARERVQSPNANQEAIGAYLKRQNEVRAQRAKARATLVARGFDETIMSGRAPLDNAMARKATRGQQRPVRPLPPKE